MLYEYYVLTLFSNYSKAMLSERSDEAKAMLSKRWMLTSWISHWSMAAAMKSRWSLEAGGVHSRVS
jgi:hypothetical protein